MLVNDLPQNIGWDSFLCEERTRASITNVIEKQKKKEGFFFKISYDRDRCKLVDRFLNEEPFLLEFMQIFRFMLLL